MARPKIRLDVEACEREAAKGLAEYQVAAALGVSADTLTRCKADQPGVAEALQRGRQAAVGRLENAAYTCALKAESMPQYQTSLIFWLKTQAGWKERQVVETVQTDEAGESRAELLDRIRALAGRDDIEADDGGA